MSNHDRDQARHEQLTAVLLDPAKCGTNTRARMTFPNGHKRSGTITRWDGAASGQPVARMNGSLLTGEILPAVRIESMQASGRYVTVWQDADALAAARERYPAVWRHEAITSV